MPTMMVSATILIIPGPSGPARGDFITGVAAGMAMAEDMRTEAEETDSVELTALRREEEWEEAWDEVRDDSMLTRIIMVCVIISKALLLRNNRLGFLF